MGIGSELKSLRHPERPSLKKVLKFIAFCGAVALGSATDAHFHPDPPRTPVETTVTTEEVIHSD